MELLLTILHALVTAIKLVFFGGALILFLCGYTCYYLIHNYLQNRNADQESRPTE